MDLNEISKKLRRRVETAARRAWMKYALRGVSGADAHDKLDLAYRVPDPWALDNPRERFRFAETNKQVERAFGRVGSALEIGCGEGHQSELLVQVCDRLTGIDVSPTAIGRAKKRLPQVDFAAGDLFAQPWASERGRFDVVLACEVLYYLSDVPKTLDAMSRLAKKGCMVTYFAPAERKVGKFVSAMPGVQRDGFRWDDSGEAEWTVAWWQV